VIVFVATTVHGADDYATVIHGVFADEKSAKEIFGQHEWKGNDTFGWYTQEDHEGSWCIVRPYTVGEKVIDIS